MSGIIKSGNVAELVAVRPLAAPKQDDEREILRRRIAWLEGELRQRETAMTTLRGDIERAFGEGKLQGHAAGLAEAEDRQDERLALLDQALGQARDSLRESLGSLERLAVVLARDCLEIILGEPRYRAEELRKIIVAQMAKIEKSALLAIAVSREDFPNEKSLASIVKRTGLESEQVIASTDTPSGNCSLQLRLGGIEVGINQQWGVLRELLSDMAEPEPIA